MCPCLLLNGCISTDTFAETSLTPQDMIVPKSHNKWNVFGVDLCELVGIFTESKYAAAALKLFSKFEMFFLDALIQKI